MPSGSSLLPLTIRLHPRQWSTPSFTPLLAACPLPTPGPHWSWTLREFSQTWIVTFTLTSSAECCRPFHALILPSTCWTLSFKVLPSLSLTSLLLPTLPLTCQTLTRTCSPHNFGTTISEKHKKEAPLNDENLYEGMVLSGFFVKEDSTSVLYFVSGCFWLLYPQQFLYYEPVIGGYYVKGPTLQLLVQLLNWPSPQADPGRQPDH